MTGLGRIFLDVPPQAHDEVVDRSRVGVGAATIESSIWVATTTGLPARRQDLISSF